MDSQTKAEVIESAVGGIAALAKEMFVRKQEQQKMERQAELQKEIEKVKAQGVQQEQPQQEQPQQTSAGQSSTKQTQQPRQRDAPARNRAPENPQGREGVVEILDVAIEEAGEVDSLLEQAEEAEDCSLCTRLIQAARKKPLPEQRRLLPELRDFLASVEDGMPTNEVAQQIRKSDELMALLKEEMSGVVPA